MKKKLLTTAMLAALGGVGTAHAVHVNPDGLGQVLLFPYYTVQNDFVTSVHITNTTSVTKAVKVRFLEGKNSQEVLDFNLYLSPYDVWAGQIVGGEDGAARLLTGDTSCITPRSLNASGEPFRGLEFRADSVNEIERTREGYIEVIEMGALDPDVAPGSYAVHDAAGVPANCAALRASEGSEVPDAIEPPSGGLFGSGHLISVNGGLRNSYDALAIDDFSSSALWSSPGSLTPSLEAVNTPADLIDGNTLYTGLVPAADSRPDVDMLSVLLMQSAIMNEYTIDAGREAKTDWVITFPTKRFYVNQGTPANRTPFAENWDAVRSESCDVITFEYWDREEASEIPQGGDFSPTPETPDFELCNEVNTLTIHRSGTDAQESALFGAQYTNAALELQPDFNAGWMRIGFEDSSVQFIDMLSEDGEVTFNGLPVIGFAGMSAVNKVSVEVDGLTVYSAYMGGLTHKGERDIEVAAP